jgi:hypothetical protein
MFNFSLETLQRFLHESLGGKIEVKGINQLGSLEEQGMKEFGYGKPLQVSFEKDGKQQEAVLSWMRGDKYGHQYLWDRAEILLFQYYTSAGMEKHVKPWSMGYVDNQQRLVPLHEPQEFFILTEKVAGEEYYRHLERIRKGDFRDADLTLARNFAEWLARVHSRKKDNPQLYLRHIRELMSSSECIWGLVDTYPEPFELFPPERFQNLEQSLIPWRWKLKNFTHRLCATHGDFHPWNVLVRQDGDFSVLDVSRGEWGEAADDVSTMTCNYFLYGLYNHSRLDGEFEKLYLTFWEKYLELTADEEILKVIAPYYVFRALVIAHPEWYPGHPREVRQGLLNFLENVLGEDEFDYRAINKYMQG